MAQSYELWKALGFQISKSLKSGSGLTVPHLGQFIYQDSLIFVPSQHLGLKPGFFYQNSLKPFNGQLPGSPPIDLDQLSKSLNMSKEEVKSRLETVGNQVKAKSSEFKQEIPQVGTLVIKGNIAGIKANGTKQDLTVTGEAQAWLKNNLGIELRSQSCRPRTAGRNREMSGRILADRPSSARSDLSRSAKSQSVGSIRGRAVEVINNYLPKITLTLQARDQSNRGLLGYAEFVSVLTGIDSTLTEPQIKNLVSLTNCLTGGRVRYKLFLDGLSQKMRKDTNSAASDYTDNYSRSNLGPIAKLIWDKKLVITEISQSAGMRPRLESQPSELLSILRKSGVFINIHQLKALLKECENSSILALLKSAKSLSGSEESQQVSLPRPYSAMTSDNSLERIRNYLAGSNLSSVFLTISKNQAVFVDDFVNYISSQSFGKIKPLDAQQGFYKITKGEDFIKEEDFCKGFAKYESQKAIQERGFKLLRAWLRQEKLSTEQGFSNMLKAANTQCLDLESFCRVLKTFNFNIYESSVLFEALDTKQDKKIDLSEWTLKVYEEEGPLQSFKDTILKYNIDKQDLLIKLNAHSKQRINIQDLADGLQKMDPTLTASNAVNMAQSAAGPKGYIDVQDFLAQLSLLPEEFQGNWKEQILRKIQNKAKGNLENLRKILEEADYRNTGKLEIAKFQECVSKAEIGLDDIEVERLSRVLDRKNNLIIDYNEFLDHLEGPNLPPQDPLKSTAGRIQAFLQQNELTLQQLLKKLGTRVTVEKFSRFLKKKVQKKFSEQLVQELGENFDVNKDGFVDLDDLKAVLDGKNYLEMKNGKVFPVKCLPSDKAKSVLKDIRTALVGNKISCADAFKVFDSEGLGVLNARQFSEGLSKYIDLSENVKNGLFATIDKLGTGLITEESFLKVIKDSNIDPLPSQDSWAWENEILSRIRKWIKTEEISVDNAFRIFDSDFDGVISKEDLRISLVSIMKIPAQDFTSSQLDRLYKLIDHFKRNSIQLSDFKLLFEEGEKPEWKKGAKQQIGLFISKNYPNVKVAFESISEFTGKIRLEQFLNWIAKGQVLKGYNLTHELLEKLFSDIDPHKKAFITENDFCLAFGGVSYKDQCVQEIKDAIRSNFQDVQSAFSFFTGCGPALSLADFSSKISVLIPKRFSQDEISYFWNSLWRVPSINFDTFSKEFNDIRFLSQFSQSKRSSKQSTPSSFLSVSSSPVDPLKRLQSLLKASPNSLESIFKQMDSDESGKLSAVEFRKALRKLNLGLSARDIDSVLCRIDTNNDGQIDWVEFFEAFKTSKMEKIKTQNAQNRISKIRENINHYMLSAKDAFQQFDLERSGFLDFQKFSSFLNRLCELSGESVPAFTVVKDLFDIIDIRKDGVIDLREWVNTFKCESKNEESKEFQDISMMIARNRKILGLTFEAMAKNGKVDVQSVKDVLMSVAKYPKIDPEVWDQVLHVAIRENSVDYKFLLDVYKDRSLKKQWHPKPRKFSQPS